jgi:integrase/recombinase XerD
MNRNNVLHVVVHIGKKAGIPNVYSHRFRHTFAVMFLSNGGNVFQLQDLLGHTSLKMCRRYVSLADRDLEEAHRFASPGDGLLRR